MNQYMLAYNASLARLDPPEPEQPFTPELFKRRSVGRNDPCACGSGKKYKKCCKNKC